MEKGIFSFYRKKRRFLFLPMNINLLIVSSSDLPDTLQYFLEKQRVNCFFARGRLKTIQVLRKETIDVIVWFLSKGDYRISGELIESINLFSSVPVALVTPEIEKELPNGILGYFDSIDINEEPQNIFNLILSACSHSRIESSLSEKNQQSNHDQQIQPEKSKLQEIEFKNLLRQKEPLETPAHPLELVTPWVSVHSAEKKMIANYTIEKRRTFWYWFVQFWNILTGRSHKNKKKEIPKS
ncbi:MAG: hypothetical protein ACI86H_001652 [bacterium]